MGYICWKGKQMGSVVGMGDRRWLRTTDFTDFQILVGAV